jgi:hypothetical protein
MIAPQLRYEKPRIISLINLTGILLGVRVIRKWVIVSE